MSTRFFGIEEYELSCLMPNTIKAMGKPLDVPLFRAKSLRYLSTIADGVIVTANKLVTDFASIPRVAWNLLSPDDPCIAAAAVVHDDLCSARGDITLEDGTPRHLSSVQSAQILVEAMEDLGANWFQRKIVFLAVRHLGPQWQ